MSEEKEYCKCTDDVACMPHQVVDGLHAKVKSLESRLKEAEGNEEVISQMAADNVNIAKQMDDLQKRLSQAEAEIDSLLQEGMADAFEFCYLEGDIQSIEHRLSHLMDVAGKLSESLVSMIEDAEELRAFRSRDLGEKRDRRLHAFSYECIEKAKALVAEWDGIKDYKQ